MRAQVRASGKPSLGTATLLHRVAGAVPSQCKVCHMWSPISLWIKARVRELPSAQCLSNAKYVNDRHSLDLGSGHDLTVCGFKARLGLCVDSSEPAWDPLSPLSLCPPPLMLSHTLSLSLSLSLSNKLKKKKKPSRGLALSNTLSSPPFTMPYPPGPSLFHDRPPGLSTLCFLCPECSSLQCLPVPPTPEAFPEHSI